MIRLASIRDIKGINRLLLQVQKVHSDIRPDLFKDGGKRRIIDAMAVWNKMSSVTSQILQ